MAKNRNHVQVEEQDVLDAERQYSQYALDSIVVESTSIPDLEKILYEFTGRTAIIKREEIIKVIQNVPSIRNSVDEIIDHLVLLTFLGVEVQYDDFRFAEDPSELRKNLILSKRYFDDSKLAPRYKINPSFWAYLELRNTEPENQPSLKF